MIALLQRAYNNNNYTATATATGRTTTAATATFCSFMHVNSVYDIMPIDC